MAEKLGACVFVVEHRFYGGSRPTKDMSTSNLVYLSAAQAIEDYAAFIAGMRKKFPELVDGKWVTFGCSYGGNLAAWMRVIHPEFVFAAVASSAPVQAQVDFVEYFEVVQNSIIRSSQGCADSVADGFSTVAKSLGSSSDRKTLKSTFNLCTVPDPKDALQIKVFWHTVYTTYTHIVQNSRNNDGVFYNNLTIDNAICRFHNQDVPYITKMKNVNQNFEAVQGFKKCNSIDYKHYIAPNLDIAYVDGESDRQWLWQQCKEFGQFQSTDSPTAGPFFGGINNLPVQFFIDECTKSFGEAFSLMSLSNAVSKTNSYFGGRNLKSSYIIFPNGNVDPWHALGKLENDQPTIVPIMIDGSSHCADMYPSLHTDSPALVHARQTISNTLTQWLK